MVFDHHVHATNLRMFLTGNTFLYRIGLRLGIGTRCRRVMCMVVIVFMFMFVFTSCQAGQHKGSDDKNSDQPHDFVSFFKVREEVKKSRKPEHTVSKPIPEKIFNSTLLKLSLDW